MPPAPTRRVQLNPTEAPAVTLTIASGRNDHGEIAPDLIRTPAATRKTSPGASGRGSPVSSANRKMQRTSVPSIPQRSSVGEQTGHMDIRAQLPGDLLIETEMT